MIVPTSNVTLPYSPDKNMPQFQLRRKNRVMTLQWEPFSCQIAATGVAYINANQCISGLPPYPIQKTLRIAYNGVSKVSFIEINPHTSTDSIRFYFDISAAALSAINDTFVVSGGTVEWITE